MERIHITYFYSLLCPHCKEVGRKVRKWCADMELDLDEIEIALRPDLLLNRKIRSVPTIVCGDRQFIGMPSKAEFLELLAGGPPGPREVAP